MISGLLAACLPFAAGCANPGIPRPPSLRLPATVVDLTGVRVGDRVELHWTAPSRTTDGLDLTGPTTVQICRDPVPAQPVAPANGSPANPEKALVAAPCTPILATTGHPGESDTVTQLPASLIAPAGQPPLVAYRIRILNSAGRSAPPSAPVLVPGGPAPAIVADFRAVQQKAGVVLEWDKSAGEPGTVEVQRTILPPPPGAALEPAAKSAAAGKGSKPNGPDSLLRSDRGKNPPAIRLHQDSEVPALPPSSPANQRDGMIDQGALQQATYTYTAQRVLTVLVAGKTIEISSEPTAPITIAMRDTFPPAPPKGLFSVPGTTRPATAETGPQRTIDLAWQPNTETDLAGYIVYRAEVATGNSAAAKPVRLTPVPLPGPAYRDTTVIPRHRYLYQVTAIDRNGNESSPSASVEDAPDGG